MILMFSKISLCNSQTCVVQLEEKDKYEIEKRRDNLYKDRYKLIIYNDKIKEIENCSASTQKELILYVERVSRGKRENKKEYGSKKNDVIYTLQDFMSCSLPKDCSFWGSGLFKIGKEFYIYNSSSSATSRGIMCSIKKHMERDESQKPYILLKKNAEKALFGNTKFKNNSFRVIFFIFIILFSLKIAFRKDLINMLNIINEKMGKVL